MSAIQAVGVVALVLTASAFLGVIVGIQLFGGETTRRGDE